MDAVIVVVLGLTGMSVTSAFVAWRAVTTMRDLLRADARDRDHLNYSMNYQTGRTLR